MKTVSNEFVLHPFCILVTAAFCFVGCSASEQETTPKQNESSVVEMEIQTTDDTPAVEKSTIETDSERSKEQPSTVPNSGGISSAESSPGLSLTAPKS